MEATLLLYVPPHALAAVLADAAQALGAARRCVVARELTKVRVAAYRVLPLPRRRAAGHQCPRALALRPHAIQPSCCTKQQALNATLLRG